MKSNKESSSQSFENNHPSKFKILIVVATIGIIIIGVVLFVVQIFSQTSSDDGPIFSDGKTTFVAFANDIDTQNPVFKRIGLRPLDNCEAVLNYYQTNALEVVTAWGLSDQPYWSSGATLEFADDMAVDASVMESTAEASSSDADVSFSTTNIQVAGVDEGDIVKTDGRYIYVFGSDQTLQIIDTTKVDDNQLPEVIATVDLDFYATDMLLSLKPKDSENMSDTLIIIGSDNSQIRLVQINLDNHQSPKITADFSIDGRSVGVRLSDNVIRLILTAWPLGFDWQYPQGSGLRAEAKALEANKEIIRNSNLHNWIPSYRDNLADDSEINSLANCSQILAPSVFSGLDSLSVMTFNASENLQANKWRTISLAASGQEIYASTQSVYVATAEYADSPTPIDIVNNPASDTAPASIESSINTIIHKFSLKTSTSDELGEFTHPSYVASGEVSGRLLNQFSMDEYKGDLRVATTLSNFDDGSSENHIKILRPQAGILEEIGTISGLGIDERIYAVRFMESQAYIVTFRQIDPLYALDLSDPTNPVALGELKITGFSSYLHPVGENLLLGVGQEADEFGRTTGLQFSLFDVSDPKDPKRISQLLLNDILGIEIAEDIDRWSLPYSSSAVEYDHRAFLFYDGSAFIPYYISGIDEEELDWRSNNSQSGILSISVSDDVLVVDQIFTATQEANSSKNIYLRPQRTIIIDNVLYGLTSADELILWPADNNDKNPAPFGYVSY